MELLKGDCLQFLKWIEDNSIDSLITDPPAGISFMGKSWDDDKGGRDQWIVWLTEVMAEALRVMKPGAHGLVWAIPRTSHWTMTALENAGFEVRDVVTHLFGSGFPKSHNIEKAIGETGKGLGTALKPAAEFWVLVRKPISERTVAANVIKYGTGGINIDASRIISNGDHKRPFQPTNNERISLGKQTAFMPTNAEGRFPANLVLDEEAAAALDKQSGFLHAPGSSGGGKTFGSKTDQLAVASKTISFKDGGGASRFFYVAKASKRDKGADNTHPTVKSTALMQYLIKLITPTGGTVLDPFMGSGSTGVAAKALGFEFIGIEKQIEYFEIAKKRINGN